MKSVNDNTIWIKSQPDNPIGSMSYFTDQTAKEWMKDVREKAKADPTIEVIIDNMQRGFFEWVSGTGTTHKLRSVKLQ